MSRQKIQELSWEILPHPAYSPDLAPSDYHVFRVLKRHLWEMKFDNQRQLEMKVSNFFDAQPPEFWQKGIEKLPDRWAQIIDSNGEYIIDWKCNSIRKLFSKNMLVSQDFLAKAIFSYLFYLLK